MRIFSLGVSCLEEEIRVGPGLRLGHSIYSWRPGWWGWERGSPLGKPMISNNNPPGSLESGCMSIVWGRLHVWVLVCMYVHNKRAHPMTSANLPWFGATRAELDLQRESRVLSYLYSQRTQWQTSNAGEALGNEGLPSNGQGLYHRWFLSPWCFVCVNGPITIHTSGFLDVSMQCTSVTWRAARWNADCWAPWGKFWFSRSGGVVVGIRNLHSE